VAVVESVRLALAYAYVLGSNPHFFTFFCSAEYEQMRVRLQGWNEAHHSPSPRPHMMRARGMVLTLINGVSALLARMDAKDVRMETAADELFNTQHALEDVLEQLNCATNKYDIKHAADSDSESSDSKSDSDSESSASSKSHVSVRETQLDRVEETLQVLRAQMDALVSDMKAIKKPVDATEAAAYVAAAKEHVYSSNAAGGAGAGGSPSASSASAAHESLARAAQLTAASPPKIRRKSLTMSKVEWIKLVAEERDRMGPCRCKDEGPTQMCMCEMWAEDKARLRVFGGADPRDPATHVTFGKTKASIFSSSVLVDARPSPKRAKHDVDLCPDCDAPGVLCGDACDCGCHMPDLEKADE
jgi:hypothetical protein